MNQKGCVVFETTKNERNYTFCMPIGAPIGEAYDVAFEVLQELVKIANAESAKAERAKEDIQATDN